MTTLKAKWFSICQQKEEEEEEEENAAAFSGT
jgi:hypothetical protein